MTDTHGPHGNNNIPPPPPDQAAIIAQLQRQLQAMVGRIAAEVAERARAAGMLVRNQFANVAIPIQPIGPRIEANTFELKIGLVEMARDIPFAGRSAEDAPKHLTKFLQIANTIKYNGVPDDVVKIRLFPFSLVDDAKDCYDSLEPNAVRTWNQEKIKPSKGVVEEPDANSHVVNLTS